MAEKTEVGQSAGVNISGTIGSVGGDIVGRDKTVGIPVATSAALEDALKPLIEALAGAPNERRDEAEAHLQALKHEAGKGKDARDGVIAKIVDGIVELAPGAASAVVSAFATPILGGIAGPITAYVIDRLKGK